MSRPEDPDATAAVPAPEEDSSEHATEVPAQSPAFPPVPVTTDPQRPAPSEDALAPTVPAYPVPEPVPDPAPDWLTPDGA